MAGAAEIERWFARAGLLDWVEAVEEVERLCGLVEEAYARGAEPGLVVPDGLRLEGPDLGVDPMRPAPTGKNLPRLFYVAPDGSSGAPGDVYSLGVILFRLLTGEFPFPGTNPVEVALGHRKLPPPSPSRLRPGIPESLTEAILRALAKSPEERFERPASLAEALSKALAGSLPATGTSQTRALKPRSWPWLAAGRGSADGAAPALREVRRAKRSSRVVLAVGAAAVLLVLAELMIQGPPGGRAGDEREKSVPRIAPGELPVAGVGESPGPLEAAATGRPVNPASSATDPALGSRAREASPSRSSGTSADPLPGVETPILPPASPRLPGAAHPATQEARAWTGGLAPRAGTVQPAALGRAMSLPAAEAPASLEPPAAGSPSAPAADPARLVQLLGEAEGLFRARSYLAPPGENAASKYRLVLDMDPANELARSRLQFIRQTFLDLADARARDGDPGGASGHLESLARAFPGDREIERRATEMADRARRAEASGKLAVQVKPWGRVFIDGKLAGVTPLAALSIPAGRHGLEVQADGRKTWTGEVTIEPGKTTEIDVALEEMR